jgi:pyruvate, water dikinase
MGEATSDVLSPLCSTLWTPLAEMGIRRAWHELGIMPRSMVCLPDDLNQFVVAPFFGRQALNVDRLVTMMGTLPGASRESVERSLLGQHRTEPSLDQAPRGRTPFVLARLPSVLLRHSSQVARAYAESLTWWQREVFDGESRSGLALLDDSQRRFGEAMCLHARSRFLTGALYGALEGIATSAGLPELMTGVFGGFGQVGEVSIADDLWVWSRGRLSEEEFLRRHGFNGRNHGNVTGVSWRIDPDPIRGIVLSMAERAEADAPRARERTATGQRRRATEQLLAALAPPKRPVVKALINASGRRIRDMEKSKAMYTMAIDGVRAGARLVGEELTASGILSRPEDAPFLTLPELLDGPPEGAAELVAVRRAKFDEYRTLELPDTFSGFPEPLHAEDSLPASPTSRLSAAAGSSGTYEGDARVAREIDETADLEPGEILVCHHTDPSWVSAMSLASALVIDVGAPTSHGAIVARELGIPCVIGTKTGTTVIHTGDRLRVDGSRGSVEILQRAQPSAGS